MTEQICTECNGKGQVQVGDSKHVISCSTCNGLGYTDNHSKIIDTLDNHGMITLVRDGDHYTAALWDWQFKEQGRSLLLSTPERALQDLGLALPLSKPVLAPGDKGGW